MAGDEHLAYLEQLAIQCIGQRNDEDSLAALSCLFVASGKNLEVCADVAARIRTSHIEPLGSADRMKLNRTRECLWSFLFSGWFSTEDKAKERAYAKVMLSNNTYVLRDDGKLIELAKERFDDAFKNGRGIQSERREALHKTARLIKEANSGDVAFITTLMHACVRYAPFDDLQAIFATCAESQ